MYHLAPFSLVWCFLITNLVLILKESLFIIEHLEDYRKKYNPYICMYAGVLSHVWLFVTPWTVANQTLLSMEFSRQEYWSGLLCPPPGDLPNPGIEPTSPALAGKFFTAPPVKPCISLSKLYYLFRSWKLPITFFSKFFLDPRFHSITKLTNAPYQLG